MQVIRSEGQRRKQWKSSAKAHLESEFSRNMQRCGSSLDLKNIETVRSPLLAMPTSAKMNEQNSCLSEEQRLEKVRKRLRENYQAAEKALWGAGHAHSVYYSIGPMKLMGRSSGFIAMHASLSSGPIDVRLTPEVPFKLDGPWGVLQHLDHLIKTKGSAVYSFHHLGMWLLSALRLIFNLQSGTVLEVLESEINKLVTGTISFPVNLPGTNYNRGVKARKNIVGMLERLIPERRALNYVVFCYHEYVLNLVAHVLNLFFVS